MTKDEALWVTRKALSKVDKAVGVIDIAQFTDDYVVTLRKWGKQFPVTLTLERVTNAKADLQRGSPGQIGDEGLGDLKQQLIDAIEEKVGKERQDY